MKPLTDFYQRIKDNKTYYYTRCKECEKIARAPDKKAYSEANKEKIAQRKKEYAQENKEHCKEVGKKYYEENKEKLSEKGKVKLLKLSAHSVDAKSERMDLNDTWKPMTLKTIVRMD